MNPNTKLLEIIKGFKKIDESLYTESANVRRDLGLDSLQIASISGEVEDATAAVTVGDWLRLIESKRG